MIHPLTQAVHRYWWILVLRGILALIFGIIVLIAPGIALLSLIFLFGAYSIIDGISAVVVAFQERGSSSRWGWLLVEGVAGIIIGIIAFVWPRETALILLYLVAIWAVVTGIMEIAAGFSLRGYLAQEWAFILAGIVSVIFGILLFLFPGAGLLSILWLLGIFAIVFGVLLIIRAFQLRAWASHMI